MSMEGEGLFEVVGVAQPDLLATTQNHQHRSLASSPYLRRNHMRCTRAGSMIKKNRPHLPLASPSSGEGGLRGSLALSLSLPNLADLDSLEGALDPLSSKRNTIFVMPE